MFVLVNLDTRSLNRTEACILFAKGIRQEQKVFDVLGLGIEREGREFFCSLLIIFSFFVFFCMACSNLAAMP